MKPDYRHPDAALIDLIGQTELAKFFGISQPAVNNWTLRGIPAERRDVILENWPEFVRHVQSAQAA